MRFTARWLGFFAVLLAAPGAFAFTFTTDDVGDFLLVGRVDMGVAEAVNVGSSNSLGQIFTVPSSSDPDVDDDPPWPLPTGGMPPVEGLSNDGNVAITNPNGSYAFSDINIWADIGVRCSQDVLTDCRDTWSNSSLTNGTFADDATLMADIETELVAAAMAISLLSATDGWSVSGEGFMNTDDQWDLSSGTVDEDTFIMLASGLNVIEIDTHSNDFSLNNAGLVINGPADAQVIFILEDQSQNFDFTSASVTKGTGGIGTNSILFVMLSGGNDTNFGFSKVILNGASFWDLSLDGGEISMDNVQGCTQLVGDKLGLQDVQLARCAVPEPGTLPLTATSVVALVFAARRYRRARI